MNKKFSALLIDELDLIDRENSELDATNPKIIKSIKKLILLMPDNNFPAIFRVQGLLAKTFVPESTKQIFEKNNIQGLLYKNIEDLKT